MLLAREHVLPAEEFLFLMEEDDLLVKECMFRFLLLDSGAFDLPFGVSSLL